MHARVRVYLCMHVHVSIPACMCMFVCARRYVSMYLFVHECVHVLIRLAMATKTGVTPSLSDLFKRNFFGTGYVCPVQNLKLERLVLRCNCLETSIMQHSSMGHGYWCRLFAFDSDRVYAQKENVCGFKIFKENVFLPLTWLIKLSTWCFWGSCQSMLWNILNMPALSFSTLGRR